jgi:hypothetical protein
VMPTSCKRKLGYEVGCDINIEFGNPINEGIHEKCQIMKRSNCQHVTKGIVWVIDQSLTWSSCYTVVEIRILASGESSLVVLNNCFDCSDDVRFVAGIVL